MNNNLKSRDLSIDLVKLVAIFGVLIIHSCSYDMELMSLSWLSVIFLRCLFGASVPLFLMASGVLMLSSDKKLELKKLYFKNILRIICAMIFWGVAYKVYHLYFSGSLNFTSFYTSFVEVLFFNQEFHFYYMHMILIVYAFLPLTKLVAEKADKKTLEYTLILWICLGIIYPTVWQFYPFNKFSGMTYMWGINLTYTSIGYTLMGYYLKKYPLSVCYSISATFLGFFLTFGLTVFKSAGVGYLYEHFLSGNTFPIFLLAVGIFSLCTHIPMEKKLFSDFAVYVSKASFFVYLSHMLVKYTLEFFGLSLGFAPNAVAVPLYAFILLIVCLLLYYPISKIPYLNKYLI